jgi:hypothetical protein
MKYLLSETVALAAASFASASVTFTATFDHWSYTSTGDSSRLSLSSTTGTSPSFTASTGAAAFPEFGDNPASDSVGAYIDVYAVYKVTATKTVGDPFSGSTRLWWEKGMSMDTHASCSNNSSADAKILGIPTGTNGLQLESSCTNHTSDNDTYALAWGSQDSILVSMTQTSSTTWEGTATIHAGNFTFNLGCNAPLWSYNEAECTATGTFAFRNVYAAVGQS